MEDSNKEQFGNENTNISENPSENHEELIPLTQTDAMSGIFTEPKETFNTITNTLRRNYWIIPTIIFIVANIIATSLFLSNEDFVNSVTDKQLEKLERRFNKNVQEGRMSQEQADDALRQSEKFMKERGTLFYVTSFGGAIIGPFVILFVLSLLYLVGFKIFRAEFEYTNILNVIGLSFLILGIGAILDVLLAMIIGSFPANLSIGTLLNSDSGDSTLRSILIKMDVFTIWFYIVVSIGLSQIARISAIKSSILVFGIWITYIIITAIVF